jgi:hypothetical protein
LGKIRLVLSDCTLISSETELWLRSTGSTKLDFALYPDASIQMDNGLKPERTVDGIFTRYRVQLPERRVEVSYNPCDTDLPPMLDELAAAPQPGPQYDVKYKPLPGSRNWHLSMPSDALAGLNNVFLQFDLTGDTAALYLDNILVDDWFIFGPPMTVGLKHFAEELKSGEFKLQLMPLTEKRNIFLENPDMKTRGLRAELKAITVLPEYEVTIQAAEPAASSKSRHENQ